MIGTSGCGKTRQIFEVLSKLFGIFFTISDSRIPGADDFTVMMMRLKDHIRKDHPEYR
jgi:tRNA splicing ligase